MHCVVWLVEGPAAQLTCSSTDLQLCSCSFRCSLSDCWPQHPSFAVLRLHENETNVEKFQSTRKTNCCRFYWQNTTARDTTMHFNRWHKKFEDKHQVHILAISETIRCGFVANELRTWHEAISFSIKIYLYFLYKHFSHRDEASMTMFDWAVCSKASVPSYILLLRTSWCIVNQPRLAAERLWYLSALYGLTIKRGQFYNTSLLLSTISAFCWGKMYSADSCTHLS